MGLDDKVNVEISIGSLASLIAGWYVMNANIDLNAIPSEVFIFTAQRLVPYLKDWDYERISLEDWINDSLIIIPKILVDDDLKDSDIYFEYPNGNVILVVSGVMP